jgi:hypothetical protein
MPVNDHDYEQIIERLRRARRQIEELIEELESARRKAHRIIQALREIYEGAAESYRRLEQAIDNAVERAKRFTKQILNEIDDLLVGIQAPLLMQDYGERWLKVNAAAFKAANAVRDPRLRVGEHWTGEGASFYYDVMKPQVVAVERLAKIAELTSAACADMFDAGLTFYGAWLVATTKYLVTAAAGIVLIGTGAGAAAGIPMLLGAVVMFAAESAAIAAYFIGKQTKQAMALKGLADSPEGFTGPDGTWPKANEALYDDATTEDGNKSDWDLRKPVK